MSGFSRDGEPRLMDARLQKLMKELGEAINQSLSDSEQIADVIARIKAAGYDVFLVLEATIGFNRQQEEPVSKPAGLPSRPGEPDFSVSAQDVKFLKSLRITVEDDD